MHTGREINLVKGSRAVINANFTRHSPLGPNFHSSLFTPKPFCSFTLMQLSFQLHKPAQFVFDQLSDMQKFCSIHPIISKIEAKGENNYVVFETLKFGFIPYSFTYPVNVQSDLTKMNVTIKAKVTGGTKIEMNFTIKEQTKNSCSVSESISFRSWLPITWMMKRIFKEQHTLLFKNMEQIK